MNISKVVLLDVLSFKNRDDNCHDVLLVVQPKRTRDMNMFVFFWAFGIQVWTSQVFVGYHNIYLHHLSDVSIFVRRKCPHIDRPMA